MQFHTCWEKESENIKVSKQALSCVNINKNDKKRKRNPGKRASFNLKISKKEIDIHPLWSKFFNKIRLMVINRGQIPLPDDGFITIARNKSGWNTHISNVGSILRFWLYYR